MPNVSAYTVAFIHFPSVKVIGILLLTVISRETFTAGASLLCISQLSIKLEPLWPCKSHPGQPLESSDSWLGVEASRLSRHDPLCALGFICTSSSTLLSNKQPQWTGHVSPSGWSVGSKSLLKRNRKKNKNHPMFGNKRRMVSIRRSGFEWHPER